MLQTSDLVAFIATTDLARARQFYEQKLGLPLTSQSDFAYVFDANGTLLRVTHVAEIPAAGYTVLGWRVTDIEATVRSLAAKDVVFKRYDGMDQDENGIWTTPDGEKVAWFADPDGHTLSLTQSSKDARERTPIEGGDRGVEYRDPASGVMAAPAAAVRRGPVSGLAP